MTASRTIFKEKSNIIFYTEVRNPMFQIVLGELETNIEEEYVTGDDGMINILNPEIVQAYIKRRTDLPNNLGRAYELIFEENSVPVLKTGAINIK